MTNVIYPVMKVISGKGNPNLKELKNISVKDSMRYLLKPGSMKGKYLGACLDSCRWGSMTTVAWEMDVRSLMNFIRKWRRENNDNEELYHEAPIDELYKKFELPYINHDKCPRNKNHKETFKDSLGRLRCGHRTVEEYKPNFLREYCAGFDELSQMKTKGFYEDSPQDQSYEGDEGWECPEPEVSNYLNKLERYESEEPTEEVVDVCYTIMSDKNLHLSFETILERLNLAPRTKTVYCGTHYLESGVYLDIMSSCNRLDELDESDKQIYELTETCPGHEEINKFTEFPFDGWDLAYYLLRWKQQKNIFGKEPKWFAEKQEYWRDTNSRRYVRISSED